MRIKEIRQHILNGEAIKSKVLAHVTHNQFEIKITYQKQESSLTNWRDKPLIFRSLDQAFDALRKAGVTETLIAQDNVPDKRVVLTEEEQTSVIHTPLSV